MASAEPPTKYGPAAASAVTSNSGRRNSWTSKPCSCSRLWFHAGPGVASATSFTCVWPRFIVGGSFTPRSNAPQALSRAEPLATSLPRESRSA